MILPRIALISIALSAAIGSADADAQGVSPQQVPEGYVLQPEGVISGAQVMDVVITTVSTIGPYTAFLIKPREAAAKPEWFYIRNDNGVKGMERGSIIGLLLGAAETYMWQDAPSRVIIRYQTVGNRKEIVAASLGSRPPGDSAGARNN
jgi:hypothetical protein